MAIAFIRELGYRKVCLRLVLKIQKIQNNICAELLQHGVKERDADNKTINGMASPCKKNSRCRFRCVKSWVASSGRGKESC